MEIFEDPNYFIGGRGQSHQTVFENNGTHGVDIFRHPHFVKYLRYFLYGPHLPADVIHAFQIEVEASGRPFTGNDALHVADHARQLTRRHTLARNTAPEEFYKLALDCGLDVEDARTVRDRVRTIK